MDSMMTGLYLSASKGFQWITQVALHVTTIYVRWPVNFSNYLKGAEKLLNQQFSIFGLISKQTK